METTHRPLPEPGQQVKSFGDDDERVLFGVKGEIFEGVEDLASELAMEFAGKVEALEKDDLPVNERIQIMRELFRLVLKPESADRFIARMRDPENPIGSRRLKEIIPWLFEQYAERPTQEEDETSSNTSENQLPGTKSLESSPIEDSIFGVSA